MFTGLVQAVGRVVERRETAAGVSLGVDLGGWGYEPGAGDSVAVNGVCLTAVAGAEAGVVGFDVVSETLRRSTLGGLREGSRVNLEHAARADTLLGGHIVQGHVDGVGVVRRVRAEPEDWRVEVGVERGLLPLLAPKGSVTVEGVSLTLAEVGEDENGVTSFAVALIPTTLAETTLEVLQEGDRVNIETDIVARQVVHALRYLQQ